MKRPEHLAVYSGDLHDHRRPDWASNPIRRKSRATLQFWLYDLRR